MTSRDRSGSRPRSDHRDPAIGPTNQAHRIRKGNIFGHMFRNPGYALVEALREKYQSCRRCSKRITGANMDVICDQALVTTDSEVLKCEFRALVFSVSKTTFTENCSWFNAAFALAYRSVEPGAGILGLLNEY